MPARYRVSQAVHVINLSTVFGLLVAIAGRSELQRGPDGLILARGYRLPIPPRRVPAFTVGNVILLRLDDTRLAARPNLLIHEARHATQYAWFFGPLMIVLYGIAAVWSWAVTGDPHSQNFFERHAGLALGGYRKSPLRPLLARALHRDTRTDRDTRTTRDTRARRP